MNDVMITIPVEEYKRLLKLEVQVALMHEAFMEEGYFFQKDIQKLFGWKKEEEENKNE